MKRPPIEVLLLTLPDLAMIRQTSIMIIIAKMVKKYNKTVQKMRYTKFILAIWHKYKAMYIHTHMYVLQCFATVYV